MFSDFVSVRVELTVVSSVTGRTGIETMTSLMELAAVPREGDWITITPGRAAHPVAAVIYGHEEEPLVRLRQVTTDDPERLDELGDLIRAPHRWKCPGWPW